MICLIDFNFLMWVLWLLLTFFIRHTALWIVFFSNSDQFNLDIIWLYNLCSFIIMSMLNKLNRNKYVGCRQQLKGMLYIYLFHSLMLNYLCSIFLLIFAIRIIYLILIYIRFLIGFNIYFKQFHYKVYK